MLTTLLYTNNKSKDSKTDTTTTATISMPTTQPSSIADNTLIILNKQDLLPISTTNNNQILTSTTSTTPTGLTIDEVRYPTVAISCNTGEGISQLESILANTIKTILNNVSTENKDNAEESILITRERHRQHVITCVGHLDNFLLSQGVTRIQLYPDTITTGSFYSDIAEICILFLLHAVDVICTSMLLLQ